MLQKHYQHHDRAGEGGLGLQLNSQRTVGVHSRWPHWLNWEFCRFASGPCRRKVIKYGGQCERKSQCFHHAPFIIRYQHRAQRTSPLDPVVREWCQPRSKDKFLQKYKTSRNFGSHPSTYAQSIKTVSVCSTNPQQYIYSSRSKGGAKFLWEIVDANWIYRWLSSRNNGQYIGRHCQPLINNSVKYSNKVKKV